MILVVGGFGSGKRDYVLSLGYGDENISASLAGEAPVLVDAQELVRDEGVDVQELAELVASSREVVVCQEVGSGIVPLDKAERLWRERAGELSKTLADKADSVVRLVCGIPQVLKGALPSPGGEHPKQGASFFTNRACEYFPCHEGIDEHDFNCMFCYCPLYALGPRCGGNFTYTAKGRKNCKDCNLPHRGEAGAQLVATRYEQLAALAGQKNDEGTN